MCCLLAEARESLARYTEAVQALSQYESARARDVLPTELQIQVCLRLAWAYGGTPEVPAAFSYGRLALALANQQDDGAAIGAGHLLLGTLYRRLGESRFAREHFLHTRTQALRLGDDLLLAQAYSGLGLVCVTEGDWEGARSVFDQGRELLNGADTPLLEGSLDINLAAIVALQGRWRESMALLERAVPHLERARHPRLIVNARSNLGYSLLRLGEMARAREVLEQSLTEARQCEALLVAESTLESLAEWHYIRGELAQGEAALGESLEMLQALRVGFNVAQARLTEGRCRMMAGAAAQALKSFQASLALSERMEDVRGQQAARLWSAEALLSLGRMDEAEQIVEASQPEIEQAANTLLIGHLREVAGHLALAYGNMTEAVRRFKQATSLWEMTGDGYRHASACFNLGVAQMRAGNLPAARAALEQARDAFERMGARPMLVRTRDALAHVAPVVSADAPARDVAARLISAQTRLLDAEITPELLLHEMAHILHQEFGAAPVVICQSQDGHAVPLAWQGCGEATARQLTQPSRLRSLSRGDGIYQVKCGAEEQYAVWLGSRGALTDELMQLFLKQLESGLERCRWRPRHARASGLDAAPAPQSFTLPGLIHCSEAMRKVSEQVHSLCSSDITVLITGESGTGKELVARAIHTLSSRAAAPFVPFNCAAMPRELIESHLFGHKRGAFTGASNNSTGVIGAAAGGTLFLDEVGEMAREVQPKLLRFLQDGEIHRLGETTPRKVDVRVIAATNRDLAEMAALGEFRADLYYRLNVIQFHLPPLRERREEIPLLAKHFLERYAAQTGRKGIQIEPSAMELLKYYDWPGNARQLENEIFRLVALTPPGHHVTADLLSAQVAARAESKAAALVLHGTPATTTLAEALEEVKRQVISDALARHNGNLSKAAGELGVSRFGLRKMLGHLRLSR